MSSGNLRGMKREVSFSKIEIREYERAIGDNVASSGVPISLGWEYYKAGELDVSSYEQHRQPRTREEYHLPSDVRMEMLKHAGYSLADRLEATKHSNIVRNRRKASAAKTKDMDRAEYIIEKAKRKVRRAIKKKTSSDKKETKLDDEKINKLIQFDRERVSQMVEMRKSSSCPLLTHLVKDVKLDDKDTADDAKPEDENSTQETGVQSCASLSPEVDDAAPANTASMNDDTASPTDASEGERPKTVQAKTPSDADKAAPSTLLPLRKGIQ